MGDEDDRNQLIEAMDNVIGFVGQGAVEIQEWPHDEDRELVATAAGLGASEKDILKLLSVQNKGRRITLAKLRDAFAHELEDAHQRLVLSVEMDLLKLGRESEDPRVRLQALSKYLTHKGGWTPTPTRVEHTGVNGDPIVIEHRVQAAMAKADAAMAAIEGGIRGKGEVNDAEKKAGGAR